MVATRGKGSASAEPAEAADDAEAEAAAEAAAEEEDFAISLISAERTREGVTEFRCHWTAGDCTWEPQENLVDCTALLDWLLEQRKKIRRRWPRTLLVRVGRLRRRQQQQQRTTRTRRRKRRRWVDSVRVCAARTHTDVTV
jgi:hypothetical protein